VEATSSAKQARKEEKWLAARAAIVAEFGDEGKRSARKSASSEASDGASSEAAALDADADAQGPGTCMDKYLTFGRFVKRIIDTKVFANTIIGCILAAAAIIGAQTYEALATQHEILFVTLDAFILAVFTLEVVLKIVALGKDWLGYFKEGWNIFDFAVVALCYMPFAGSAVAVLRLLRLLRVLKLFNNIKELQIILSGLAKGMSSVSYIGLLMFLLFYVFGIVALMFFRCEPPPFRGVRQPTGTDITRLPQTKRPRALPGPARDDGHALPLRHNGRLDRCDVRLDVRMPHVPLRQRRGPAQVREFGRLWPVRRDMYVPTTCCFKMALGSRCFVHLQSGSCSSCCRRW